VFGLVAVYGASSLTLTEGQPAETYYAVRQLLGISVGGILMIVASQVDYYRWRQLAWPMLIGTILLLLITVLPFTHSIARELNGARRWIRVGPVSLQPSELARLVVVIWCAMLATKKGIQVREFRKGVMPFVVVLGTLFGLVLLQPNLSMAALIVMLGGVVLFTAGARIGHFAMLAAAGVLVALKGIESAPYRLARLTSFLTGGDPLEGGYQIRQAMTGFGSGQLFGVGIGEGQQKLFLPYAYSDFLFSSIGEEWGFVGACFVIGLYSTFCWLGFRIARTASDPFGQYVATGITAGVGLTALMHMAVNVKLMPTTGLTLPFMSFGLSSQVISLLGVGILINIGRLRGKPRAERRSEPRTEVKSLEGREANSEWVRR
ncbi:MAG TPA: putative peptidoglycan glycosyltransferase FtsW, partial [Gemmatimonadales bacterium]|nr:putative peptidoglycan glycosyltransferase FtsW [Gemmatimonadales bacterium]